MRSTGSGVIAMNGSVCGTVATSQFPSPFSVYKDDATGVVYAAFYRCCGNLTVTNSFSCFAGYSFFFWFMCAL